MRSEPRVVPSPGHPPAYGKRGESAEVPPGIPPTTIRRCYQQQLKQIAWTRAHALNLWYTRAAVFFHELQEAASPGYLGRMQQRAQRDFNQSYWLKPGEALPDRAPDLMKALDER